MARSAKRATAPTTWSWGAVPKMSAAVSRAVLIEARDAVLASYGRRVVAQKGAAPAERPGDRGSRSSDALLGLKIDTLLRYLSRSRPAYAKRGYIAKVLARSTRQVGYGAEWLEAKFGVTRLPGERGGWTVKVPGDERELREGYIALPEAALFNLSAFDFFVLALLHEWAEERCRKVAPEEDRRRTWIPLRFRLDGSRADVAGCIGVSGRRAAGSFTRLAARRFIMLDPFTVTPDEGQAAIEKARAGDDVFDLLRNPRRSTRATFGRLRGEPDEGQGQHVVV